MKPAFFIYRRNIVNECFLRDCSRKQCAAYQARGHAGKPTTNHVIYGCRKDPVSGLYPYDHYDCSTYALTFRHYHQECFGHYSKTS